MAQREEDTAGVLAPPPLFLIGPLAVGLLMQRACPAPLLPRALGRPLGWSLLGLAGALHLWFGYTMRRGQTPVDPRKPTAQLLTGGPFRYSRNPSYLAFVGHYLGISCLANSRWPLLLLPLGIWLLQWGAIDREERYLQRRFGHAYAAYHARVRRWL